MRKYIKKQLYDILDAMRGAGILSENLCGKEQKERYGELLIQQQEAAVRIGEAVEQTEGEGHSVVEALENHCELLWECAQVDSESKRIVAYRKLRQSYAGLENQIKKDIPEQYEMLFLPYKASMWDSLESIWLAANEDPDCCCYVVSVPYFERDPDGSFKNMKSEAELYPDYVPITDYRDYDLSRHPDVIFIHNPYDGANRVTSIHPDYYSDKLKQYTDMLVYIPYFISVGDVQEHLILTPGVSFADKVIVQSERVRNTYIQTVKKFEQENCCKGMFGDLKNKFLALGSPKIDKVINTKLEDVMLPEEWRNLIYRPDGTKKKILLYNTSIATQLQCEEEFIYKIESVIECMKDHKDVLLLWRPHPLALSTYTSMHPDLLDCYCRLVEDFRREGWGIYDDTPDLNRAIAISDALYGDSSSLVELYKSTGKPILIQNIGIK